MSPGGGMADTIGLGPIARKGMEVRLLSWAPVCSGRTSTRASQIFERPSDELGVPGYHLKVLVLFPYHTLLPKPF